MIIRDRIKDLTKTRVWLEDLIEALSSFDFALSETIISIEKAIDRKLSRKEIQFLRFRALDHRRFMERIE